MKIGVIGHRGRLGSELVRMGCVPIDADVTSKASLMKALPGRDVVINCAAFTQVDACEDEVVYREKALPINAKGPYNLGMVCDYLELPLIHISSDYIFGGKRGPYSERFTFPDDEDGPVNKYGLSKLGGEAMLLGNKYSYIVRTTGLYGGSSGRPDFLQYVLKTLESGQHLMATNDLQGNQTYVPHLAEALIFMAQNLRAKPSVYPKLLHIASKGICTRYDFARTIALTWGYATNSIFPAKSDEIDGWIAKRPIPNSGLLTKTAADLGIPIFPITEGLNHAHENWNRNSSV